MPVVSALRLLIDIGGSFEDKITWSAEGVPVPLPIGTIAEAKVRSTLQSATVLARFSTSPTGSDGLITLTDPGITVLSMTAAQTALLTPITDAVFDIKYTFAGSPPTVIVKLMNGQGRCNIRGIVTRP